MRPRRRAAAAVRRPCRCLASPSPLPRAPPAVPPPCAAQSPCAGAAAWSLPPACSALLRAFVLLPLAPPLPRPPGRLGCRSLPPPLASGKHSVDLVRGGYLRWGGRGFEWQGSGGMCWRREGHLAPAAEAPVEPCSRVPAGIPLLPLALLPSPSRFQSPHGLGRLQTVGKPEYLQGLGCGGARGDGVWAGWGVVGARGAAEPRGSAGPTRAAGRVTPPPPSASLSRPPTLWEFPPFSLGFPP